MLTRETISKHYKEAVSDWDVDINLDHLAGGYPDQITARAEVGDGVYDVMYHVANDNFSYQVSNQATIDIILISGIQTKLKEINAEILNL